MSDDDDALATWCRVRERVDWSSAAHVGPAPVRPVVDGLVAWCEGPVRRRDPDRAGRLLAATALSRAAAVRGEPLTESLLAGWQVLLLGVDEVRPRQSDAFAKGGRERYGLTPRTWQDFAACLRQSADASVPLPARAARAYLDIAFFHPYPDGNARLALLVLAHVLEREGVRLDEVGPLQTTRYADDPEGALDLAALVTVLIDATHRRASARGGKPPPPKRTGRHVRHVRQTRLRSGSRRGTRGAPIPPVPTPLCSARRSPSRPRSAPERSAPQAAVFRDTAHAPGSSASRRERRP